ncbi:unnamed protein product [Schistocephalus solidus]|uniref:Uncharacterized protein n=1 Tax=Schistocephalus solidus TaxID=70667 RepID=A0A183TUD6_SCHSO|nr:unnamed protein product [Schistocephalus solidus]
MCRLRVVGAVSRTYQAGNGLFGTRPYEMATEGRSAWTRDEYICESTNRDKSSLTQGHDRPPWLHCTLSPPPFRIA